MFRLTWTCHVCGDERNDAQISVYKRDISEQFNQPAGSQHENIRYCNDRPECVEAVKEFSFVGKINGKIS